MPASASLWRSLLKIHYRKLSILSFVAFPWWWQRTWFGWTAYWFSGHRRDVKEAKKQKPWSTHRGQIWAICLVVHCCCFTWLQKLFTKMVDACFISSKYYKSLKKINRLKLLIRSTPQYITIDLKIMISRNHYTVISHMSILASKWANNHTPDSWSLLSAQLSQSLQEALSSWSVKSRLCPSFTVYPSLNSQ